MLHERPNTNNRISIWKVRGDYTISQPIQSFVPTSPLSKAKSSPYPLLSLTPPQEHNAILLSLTFPFCCAANANKSVKCFSLSRFAITASHQHQFVKSLARCALSAHLRACERANGRQRIDVQKVNGNANKMSWNYTTFTYAMKLVESTRKQRNDTARCRSNKSKKSKHIRGVAWGRISTRGMNSTRPVVCFCTYPIMSCRLWTKKNKLSYAHLNWARQFLKRKRRKLPRLQPCPMLPYMFICDEKKQQQPRNKQPTRFKWQKEKEFENHWKHLRWARNFPSLNLHFPAPEDAARVR